MIQRRSGTSRLWSLPSGSKGFSWIWAAVEGQEHMKMKFSYKDNWIWQRLTLGTCPRQVTSHCIQICYLQSTRTTMSAFSERHYFSVCFRHEGWPGIGARFLYIYIDAWYEPRSRIRCTGPRLISASFASQGALSTRIPIRLLTSATCIALCPVKQ